MADFDHRGRFSMIGALGYWASCAVATYEVAASRKSTSKADLNRLKSIAEGMIADVELFGPNEEGLKILKKRFAEIKR
jgi:hypothetical protein